MNDWFVTFTGKKVHVMSPIHEDIDIADIAHALSNICRFSGHVRRFYSVAEHSVRVALAVQAERPDLAKAALLHDAAEAYIGDVISPLKNCLPHYKNIEEQWERTIAETFGVFYEQMNDPYVKLMDRRDLISARRDLGHENWSKHVWQVDEEKLEPLSKVITGYNPWRAEAEFRLLWGKLEGVSA